jgi:transcriptional regulator with XRE-family HTH domain
LCTIATQFLNSVKRNFRIGKFMDQPTAAITRTPSDRNSFGQRVRRLRKEKGWTLTEVAISSGLAPSTISKVERGQMSLTYDRLVLLARGLEVHLTELFGSTPCTKDRAPGRIAVTRAGQANPFPSRHYLYEMLCTDYSGRRMVPLIAHIKPRSVAEFPEFAKHAGEEFIYVLSGTLSVHIDSNPVITLETGDCVYFDSSYGHAYVTAGDAEAIVLGVCWQPETSNEHLPPPFR